MSYLVFDFETCYSSNLPWLEGAYCVSLCLIYEGELRTWVFNHSEKSPLDKVDLDEIQVYFNKAGLIVGQNIKFDLHWLRAIGIDFSENKLYCTMVAEYLLNNQDKLGNNLKDLSIKYGLPEKIDAVKEWWDSGYETYDIPLSTLIPYGEQDVLNTEAIFLKQRELITKERKNRIIQLRCESLRVTQEIEWNGMCLDTTLCKELSEDYATKINEIEESIYDLIRSTYNELSTIPFKLTSNDHLSAILFGGIIRYDGLVQGKKEGTLKKGKEDFLFKGLGFTPAPKTETAKAGYFQTDVGQLSELKPKKGIQQDVINAIGELSKMTKMKSTYCDGLLVAETKGFVHPSINECVTVTGRYSSQKPNSQNIPREGTSPIKKMFITRYLKEET